MPSDMQNKAYETFLQEILPGLHPTGTKKAYVHFVRGGIYKSGNPTLIEMTSDNVASVPNLLNPDVACVQWLQKQIASHDEERENVVALAFDRNVVLSDVIRK